MTVETFFANFGHLADAPNGMQKLRELILQLAVQGKLVPQDSNDEPASALLERIKVKKEKLVKEGMVKKGRKPSPISDDDHPFDLPEKWAWTRLGNALLKLTDGTHHSPANTASGDYKYVTAKNIKKEGIKLSNITYVTKEVHEEIFSRCNPGKGDLLYIKDGATTGIVTINDLDEPFSMLSSVALLKLPKEVFNRYLLHVLRSPFCYDLMREGMSGVAITRVTLTKMNNALVPLPPLEEQKRIVIKVDQLMALCDELEARQQKQQQGRVRINNASLDALLLARDPDEFADHWQRISTNFDLLYDHPETIAKLRAAILQLAVQGKLVPQDPNDEPASVLLERIKAEKKRLCAAEKIKLPKTLLPIDDDEKSTRLPHSWEWVRLEEVFYPVPTGNKKVNTRDILKEGEFPVVDQGQSYIAGYINDASKVIHIPGPVVVFGDHTRAVKFVDFDFVGGADGIKVLRPVRTFERYFFKVLEGYDLEGRGYGRHYKILLSNLFPLPPHEEQKRIVAKVDQLMTLCDELEAKLNQFQQHSDKLMEATVLKLLVA